MVAASDQARTGGGSANGQGVQDALASAPAAWAEVDDDAGGLPAWTAEEREDCGYPGITKEECVGERGCRWDDSAVGLAWCFL